MKIINGNLIMKEDMIFNGDLKVEGNILGKNGNIFNLIVNGDLDCGNLTCKNLNCGDLNCRDLDCWNLNCRNLDFYAIAIAYNSFKCKSWKARRKKFIIKCLDSKIKGKELLGEKG